MQLSSIRARARAALSSTKGIYLLFLIPLAYYFTQVFVQGISQAVLPRLALYDSSDGSEFNTVFLILQFLAGNFLLILGIINAIAVTSIAFTSLKIVRGQSKETGVKDAFSGFKSDKIGKILLVSILKGILLALLAIVFTFGFFLFIFAIVGFASSIIGIFQNGGSQTFASLGYVFDDIGSLIKVSFSDALPNIFSADGVDENALLLALPALAIIAFLISLPTMLIGALIYYPFAYSYRLTDYVLADQIAEGRYTGTWAVLKESRALSKGYKMKLFLLDLSFIGWYLLPTFTFGLAYIYVLPYKTLADTVFYQEVKENKKEAGSPAP